MQAAPKPFFLITIDTEGDNLWSRPASITTRNSRFLPRFQDLCERYGFKPTYLTNYEMAMCPDFHAFAKGVLARGTGEIGMHLHAWHSPPDKPLSGSDYSRQPLLIEFSEDVIRSKVGYLTGLLEQRFDSPMRSHRAGRWGFDAVYARVLLDHGYRCDCSVTPLVNWAPHLSTDSSVLPDYSTFPHQAYWIDPEDIRRPGNSGLLEVPMTVMSLETAWVSGLTGRSGEGSLLRRLAGRFYPRAQWLRPNGNNLRNMLRVLGLARRQGRPFVEFMLHSSEFMPGGSPVFPTEESIERLYGDLEQLMRHAAREYRGATLSEFTGWQARKDGKNVEVCG